MKSILLLVIIQIATFARADSATMATMHNELIIDSLGEIVYNKDVTYTRRLELFSSHGSLSFYTEHFDKLYPLYDRLLADSKNHSDMEGIFFGYCSIADLYFCSGDRSNTEKYLNLADVYVEQVKNDLYLAMYYRIKAQYIQRYLPTLLPEAVDNYQNSLSYYDKLTTKGRENEITTILRNLSFEAFLRNDSAYISKSISRLQEVSPNEDSPIVAFNRMDMISSLFAVNYHYSSEDRFLDSAIYYHQKCLDLNEKGLLPKSFNYRCVELITIVAEALSMKKNPDIALIDSLLSTAIVDNTDSLGMARVFQTKAYTYFNKDMIDSAEVIALKAKSYLESYYRNKDYSLEKRNIEFLRMLYEEKGDYKKVIEYNNLWSNINDEIRTSEVTELALQFEADMKDAELKRLYAEALYYENRNKLIILTCALLFLASFFLLFYLQLKKRNLQSQLALIDAEREETNLKVKLKEEQTVKMQLEKYVALSDFRLAELELIGKTKDLEQLYKDKEELDSQVEMFRQKVEAFEEQIEKETHEGVDLQYVITEDLRRLFSRQKPEYSKYIYKLEALSKTYIDTINANSDGGLSLSYLKYCVSFALGMSSNEVADCFNIELTSVHMIRYRIKKKFRLRNDDDLSQYLRLALSIEPPQEDLPE